MKTLITVCAIALVIGACGTRNSDSDKGKSHVSRECSYEIYGKDTVNKVHWGSKEGYWQYIQRSSGVTVEKGFYKNNKKEGFWKRYSTKGQLIDSVNYKSDAVIY